MNRLDRITAILIQLQSKKLVTATELAHRFEVSVRTIYRDIRSLEQAGVPIGVREGFGYFIVSGYHLPPVMFSEKEANALITAEKILKYHTEESLLEAYSSALIKLKSVLKSQQKDKVDYLDQRIAHYPAWAPKSNYLSQIQLAITDSLTVEISYLSNYKNEHTTRKVNPYALYFNGATWAFIGYCLLREDIREFRLDRIQSYYTTSQQFEPDSSFNLDHYFIQRKKIYAP